MGQSDHLAPIIAHCARCGNDWRFESTAEPQHLEGCCGDCQGERDVEQPLTFRHATEREDDALAPPLPDGWLAEA